MHLEQAKGSDAENQAYCSKEDKDPFVIGVPSSQGKRNDLLNATDLLRESGSLKRVAEDYPVQFVKYYRGLENYRNVVAPQPRRDFKSEVIVFVGPPGVGKSSLVRQLSPDVYTKPTGEWFDGWDGESDLLLDDFHGDLRFSVFKQLCDRYQFLAPIKGGFINARPKRIFITSNLKADEWYKSEALQSQMHKDAIHRRLTTYKWLEREGDEIVQLDVMGDDGPIKINF